MTESKKKGPYTSLKTWVEILMNLKSLSQEAQEIIRKNAPEWYFSDEGKAAYIAADTPARKTKYFFDYLMAKKAKNVTAEKAKDVYFKTALVMATAMDKSSLEFGGYPNILTEDKNTILKDVVKMPNTAFDIIAKTPQLLSYYFLSSLHRKEMNHYLQSNAYLTLSFCKDGDQFSDLYKIEKSIIGICCGDSLPLIPYDNYKLSFTNDEDADDNGESEENN